MTIRLTIKTKSHKEIIDLTELINSKLKDVTPKDGLCHLFVTHTTCSLATADLDPGTDQDILETIDKIFPKGNWRHPHDPGHVGEHIMSTLVGQSLMLSFSNKKLVLGTWQRVILVELSGPRQRNLILQFLPVS